MPRVVLLYLGISETKIIITLWKRTILSNTRATHEAACFKLYFCFLSQIGSKIWCGQTYNDVFSGEILINTLLADSANFTSRDSAIECAQSVLDKKLITCITKRRKFDDGDRLYCINQEELGKFDLDGLPSAVRESAKATHVKESLAKRESKEVRYAEINA